MLLLKDHNVGSRLTRRSLIYEPPANMLGLSVESAFSLSIYMPVSLLPVTWCFVCRLSQWSSPRLLHSLCWMYWCTPCCRSPCCPWLCCWPSGCTATASRPTATSTLTRLHPALRLFIPNLYLRIDCFPHNRKLFFSSVWCSLLDAYHPYTIILLYPFRFYLVLQNCPSFFCSLFLPYFRVHLYRCFCSFFLCYF